MTLGHLHPHPLGEWKEEKEGGKEEGEVVEKQEDFITGIRQEFYSAGAMIHDKKKARKQVLEDLSFEILARQWLHVTDKNREHRTYLIDHVLPALTAGVAEILAEVERLKILKQRGGFVSMMNLRQQGPGRGDTEDLHSGGTGSRRLQSVSTERTIGHSGGAKRKRRRKSCNSVVSIQDTYQGESKLNLGIEEDEMRRERYDPLQRLAQYLMRNNPRYSNLMQSNPYAKQLKSVATTMKERYYKKLHGIQDEEEEKEMEEMEKFEKKERRKRKRELKRRKTLRNLFDKWDVKNTGKVNVEQVQDIMKTFEHGTSRFSVMTEEEEDMLVTEEWSSDGSVRKFLDKEAFVQFMGNRSSSFDEREFRDIMDKVDDAIENSPEYKETIKELFPIGANQDSITDNVTNLINRRIANRNLQLDQLFSLWDSNNSGYLEAEEIMPVLARFQDVDASLAHDEYEYMLKLCDRNHDRKISREELNVYVNHISRGFYTYPFDLIIQKLLDCVQVDGMSEYDIEVLRTKLLIGIEGDLNKTNPMDELCKAAFSAITIFNKQIGGQSVNSHVYIAKLFTEHAGKSASSRALPGTSKADMKLNALEESERSKILKIVYTSRNTAHAKGAQVNRKDHSKDLNFRCADLSNNVSISSVNKVEGTEGKGAYSLLNHVRSIDKPDGSLFVFPLRSKSTGMDVKSSDAVLGFFLPRCDGLEHLVGLTDDAQMFYEEVALRLSEGMQNIEIRFKVSTIAETSFEWIKKNNENIKEMQIYYVDDPNNMSILKSSKKGAKTNAHFNKELNPEFKNAFHCVEDGNIFVGDNGIAYLPVKNEDGKVIAVVEVVADDVSGQNLGRDMKKLAGVLGQVYQNLEDQEKEGEENIEAGNEDDTEEIRLRMYFHTILLQEAREMVLQLQQSHAFNELKSYLKPPEMVQDIFTEVLRVTGVHPEDLSDWMSMRKYIDKELIHNLVQYDPFEEQDITIFDNINILLQKVTHEEAEAISQPSARLYELLRVFMEVKVLDDELQFLRETRAEEAETKKKEIEKAKKSVDARAKKVGSDEVTSETSGDEVEGENKALVLDSLSHLEEVKVTVDEEGGTGVTLRLGAPTENDKTKKQCDDGSDSITDLASVRDKRKRTRRKTVRYDPGKF
eukprot:Nk52_evm20s246 gene=Nk52_evmTU20s246